MDHKYIFDRQYPEVGHICNTNIAHDYKVRDMLKNKKVNFNIDQLKED